MADWVVNVEIRESFATGEAGETFTPLFRKFNGASSSFAPTFPGASGAYEVVYTPTVVGLYTGSWQGSLSGAIVNVSWTVITAAQADPVTYIAAGNVTLQSPVLISGLVEIYQGESYAVADGTNRALEWQTTDAATWPTLTSATIAFIARHDQTAATISVAGSVVTATGATKKVRVELAPTDTAAKPTGEWDYQVIATLPNTHPVTLASGEMTLFERLRA